MRTQIIGRAARTPTTSRIRKPVPPPLPDSNLEILECSMYSTLFRVAYNDLE